NRATTAGEKQANENLVTLGDFSGRLGTAVKSMPEGGLELSSPPCFRNLRILLAHRTHRTHRTQALHTLGTHAPIWAKGGKGRCVSRQQRDPMENLKETHGEPQVRSHRFAVELSEKLVVQNLDLRCLFVSESTKFFFPSSF